MTIFEIAENNRRPPNITPNNWTSLKRLASTLKQIKREDFYAIGELCKLLKIFHKETLRVYFFVLFINNN
jgi:hypothetical protein